MLMEIDEFVMKRESNLQEDSVAEKQREKSIWKSW